MTDNSGHDIRVTGDRVPHAKVCHTTPVLCGATTSRQQDGQRESGLVVVLLL